jgi:hypothetical protein
VLKMEKFKNKNIKKTKAKFVEKDDSDTEDDGFNKPRWSNAVDHVQDPAEDDLRAEIQLGAASLPTENVRNIAFQPVLPDIYETRHQSLVEAIQRMQLAEGQLQNPNVLSTSAAMEPEVISISSSSAQEVITISSTSAHSSSAQELDIFDQETIELEDDVFNPIEGASNQVAQTDDFLEVEAEADPQPVVRGEVDADAESEANTSGLGWGSLQPGWEEKLETAAREKEEEVEAEAKANAEAVAKTETSLPLGAQAVNETVATRKGTGKGKGSYDRVIAGAIKKSRNARNANSLGSAMPVQLLTQWLKHKVLNLGWLPFLHRQKTQSRFWGLSIGQPALSGPPLALISIGQLGSHRNRKTNQTIGSAMPVQTQAQAPTQVPTQVAVIHGDLGITSTPVRDQ